MSALLLDTTALIDAERSPDGLDELVGDDDLAAIAAVTAAELLVGIELASGANRSRRRAFVATILDVLPVVPYDIRVAATHAKLLVESRRLGRPRGAHDLIIAATARATGRTVVTADKRGFDGLSGVSVVSHR